MHPERIPLSVAIITKDEEKNLPDCLKSVSFADDIVIVDSGSTDRTVEIAKEFGCRVFIEDWKGNGPQKNSAVDKCRYDWVFSIDADERIPEETKKDILKVLENPSADAYSFPRKNYLRDRWIKHSDWWPDRVIRLVRKDKGRFNAKIHDKWATYGTLNNMLQNPVVHNCFSNYSEMLRSLDYYSTATAKELLYEGKKAIILAPFYHGISMFFKTYFLKMGFLDGMDGFVIAVTKAGGSFFKYAKLLELQREEKFLR
jgi:glycosyltransferase involved in cell wall biosynthesis